MKYKLLVVKPTAKYGEKGMQFLFSDLEHARSAAKDLVRKFGEGCRADIYLLSETLVESLNLDAPLTTK